MSVAVYSRLAKLLGERNMTVRELQHEIVTRFGRAVDARVLDRLTREPRVRRPDMELAAAAAAVLGVELGDLFAVDAAPMPDQDEAASSSTQEKDILSPEQSQRLSLLFDLQDQRPLSLEEQVNLDQLVAAWGYAMNERGMQELARQRGVPLDQIRADVLADVARAQAWWQEVQADPARLDEAVRAARVQQKARASG